jgi:hypothetical protein
MLSNNLHFSIFIFDGIFNMYLYNKKYSIFLKLNFGIKIISSQCVLIKKKFNTTTYIDVFLQKYIKQINNYNFVKIKFSGKGYKIKKNNKKHILLMFNRAHITHLWWRNIFLKKLKKYKIYIKYTQVSFKLLKTILSVRNINIFTKKGLRQSKQLLYKKKGKK